MQTYTMDVSSRISFWKAKNAHNESSHVSSVIDTHEKLETGMSMGRCLLDFDKNDLLEKNNSTRLQQRSQEASVHLLVCPRADLIAQRVAGAL